MGVKVLKVVNFILANPDKSRKEYVIYAQRACNAKKNNANVYVHNALKRIEEFGANAALELKRGPRKAA